MDLLQFSTGASHPLAAKSSIEVGLTRRSRDKLSVKMEAAGPYLLVLLTWSLDDVNTEEGNEPMGRLILFNWCTGERIVVSPLMRT